MSNIRFTTKNYEINKLKERYNNENRNCRKAECGKINIF
ncbi:hypothetical protein MSIBF_A2820005 [groundwater metagenome]|uniref:Uncharacterized protein n=1 Tax=groundwater metagenome TaxID=717931 RepID=A0A098EA26_9ZZZZ